MNKHFHSNIINAIHLLTSKHGTEYAIKICLFMEDNHKCLYSKEIDYSANSEEEYIKAINQLCSTPKNPQNSHIIYFLKGIAYFKLKKYSDAISEFTKNLLIDFNNLRAHHYRALTYFNSGNYCESEKDYYKITQLDPQDNIAYSYLAEINSLLAKDHKDHRINIAIKYYSKSIELNPSINTYKKRARLFERVNNLESAIKDMQIVYKIYPENQQALTDLYKIHAIESYYNDYYKTTIDLYEKLFKINPAVSFNKDILLDSFNKYALSQFNLKKYANAIKYWKSASKLKKESKLTFYNIGLSYLKLNNFDKAIQNLNTSLKKDPEYREAKKMLAKVYFESGNNHFAKEQYEKAIDLYTKSIEYDSHNKQSLQQRAKSKLKIGDILGHRIDILKSGSIQAIVIIEYSSVKISKDRTKYIIVTVQDTINDLTAIDCIFQNNINLFNNLESGNLSQHHWAGNIFKNNGINYVQHKDTSKETALKNQHWRRKNFPATNTLNQDSEYPDCFGPSNSINYSYNEADILNALKNGDIDFSLSGSLKKIMH